MKKKLVLPFKIKPSLNVDKYILDIQEDFTKIVIEFCRHHVGSHGEVTYEIIDRVPHGFHKWYRGYLLPTIAQSVDPVEIKRMHLHLKQRYLLQEVNGWDTIPDKYLKSGVAVVKPFDNMMNVPSGRSIIILNDEKPVELIKSNSVLTQKEMRSFILDCELIIQGLVDAPEPDKSLIRYREDVMGKEK